ncbi:MAG: thioredoxin family protein [Trebonia sp.]
MIGGLIVLVVVLVAASAAGLGLRARQGRFRPQKLQSTTLPAGTGRGDSVPQAASGNALTAADLGAPLGRRATLVQFSTEFCTYCGPTRELLAEVAGERDGVAFVEIDAADRMDLTRRLRIMSTPTVLVLGADGAIERRSSGRPRKSDLLTAVGTVLGGGSGS